MPDPIIVFPPTKGRMQAGCAVIFEDSKGEHHQGIAKSVNDASVEVVFVGKHGRIESVVCLSELR